MDVPAKEVPRLLAVDEFADRLATEMFAFGRAVERSSFGRSVADEHQWVEAREFIEALAQFFFAVLARRIKGCWIGISEAGDLITADIYPSAMEVMKAKFAAKTHDIGLGFMVSRQNIHTFGAFLKNRPHRFEATPKIGEVAGGEVVIRFGSHQFFEGSFVAVNIGEDEELHQMRVAGMLWAPA